MIKLQDGNMVVTTFQFSNNLVTRLCNVVTILYYGKQLNPIILARKVTYTCTHLQPIILDEVGKLLVTDML